MDILSIVFAQLFVLLALVAIGGVVYFAYQANLQQQQKTRGRGLDKKERKPQAKPSRQPAPEPEEKEEEEPEPEPEVKSEPEPEPSKKKNKKKKATEEKKAEEKKAVEKPAAKAAAPAAKAAAAPPAKKAAQKPVVPPPQQKPGKAKVEETKEPAKVEQKTKKDDKKDKSERKKKLLQQQHDHEAELAGLQKKSAPKPQVEDPEWTNVSKSTKRNKGKTDEKKQAHLPSVITETMEVHLKHLPVIMGEKAIVLKTIQKKTETKITLPKKADREKSGERQFGGSKQNITIEGSPKGVAEAQALITELITKGYTKETHPDVVVMTLKLGNPERDRPILVGKGGDHIRALQKHTGCKINLPPKEEHSDDVTIVGKEENCNKAREAIITLLTEGYSTVTHEHHVRMEVEVAPEQYSLLIGKEGKTIRDIQQSTETRINIPKDRSGNVTIVGLHDGVAAARQRILAVLNRDSTTVVVEEDPNDPWAAVNVSSVDDVW